MLKIKNATSGEYKDITRTEPLPVSDSATYLTRTTSGVVMGTPCIARGYIVTVAMSAAATTVYDNASAASGTVLFVIPASTAVGSYPLPCGVLCTAGIYASFAGTGTVNFLYVDIT